MDAEQIRSIDVINGVINPIAQPVDPGDKGLNVIFKMHSHFDDVKTREEGRPIFEMREYIMILIPGDTTSSVFRPVRPGDKERFPEQYLRFQVGKEQAVGTPLSEWPQVTRAQVDELAFFKIQTVEQLANMSDANAQRYMGLNTLREKAKRYLEQLQQDAPLHKVEAELAERDEKINTLTGQLEQMQKMIEELQRTNRERAEQENNADAESRGARAPYTRSRRQEKAEAQEE